MVDENNNIDQKENDIPIYSISSAARKLNISVHTLRMYEKEGLIIPFKKDSHHRLYSEHDIERLQCIRNLIREKKFTIPAIKAIYSFLPCWTIINCPESERENCPAYNENEQPCWTYKHESSICSSINCRDCTIYKDFNTCDKIKTKIKELTK